MKLTKRQLRRLIESVIYENVKDPDGKTPGTDKPAVLDASRKKKLKAADYDIEKVAKALNYAMRGSVDDDAVYGLLKSLGVPDSLMPGQMGTRDDILTDALVVVKTKTDELYDDDDVMSSLSEEELKKVNNKADFFGLMMGDIEDEYDRLFSRNLRSDLNGDLNQNDKNNLEEKVPGIKEYLKGKFKK